MSVREVMKLTGAEVKSWTEPARGASAGRPTRTFNIEVTHLPVSIRILKKILHLLNIAKRLFHAAGYLQRDLAPALRRLLGGFLDICITKWSPAACLQFLHTAGHLLRDLARAVRHLRGRQPLQAAVRGRLLRCASSAFLDCRTHATSFLSKCMSTSSALPHQSLTRDAITLLRAFEVFQWTSIGDPSMECISVLLADKVMVSAQRRPGGVTSAADGRKDLKHRLMTVEHTRWQQLL